MSHFTETKPVTTSATLPPFNSEVDERTIEPGRLAYFRARLQDNMHAFLLEKFIEASRYGLTRAKLARRIGKRPETVTRVLSSPSNMELYTISDFLLGICGEELDPASSAVEVGRHNDLSWAWRPEEQRPPESSLFDRQDEPSQSWLGRK